MKYIVEIPWHGVKKGAIVELKELHPSLKANVRPYIEVESDGDDVDKAKGEAALIIEQSNEEAKLIIEKANEEAMKIVSEAEGKAKGIIAEAEKKAGELKPATPTAPAEKPAAKK
ncbi:TPA: hypothetical protein AB5C23_001295 [Vibrio cholerae]